MYDRELCVESVFKRLRGYEFLSRITGSPEENTQGTHTRDKRKKTNIPKRVLNAKQNKKIPYSPSSKKKIQTEII